MTYIQEETMLLRWNRWQSDVEVDTWKGLMVSMILKNQQEGIAAVAVAVAVMTWEIYIYIYRERESRAALRTKYMDVVKDIYSQCMMCSKRCIRIDF